MVAWADALRGRCIVVRLLWLGGGCLRSVAMQCEDLAVAEVFEEAVAC